MTKRSSVGLRFATFGLLAVMVLLAGTPAGPVTGDVGLGHSFYGSVKLDGEDAAVGTVVSARIGETEYDNWEVIIAGQYFLLVQGDIVEGATVEFYVAGRKADQTHPFHSGLSTPFDLTATTPTFTLTMAADPEVGGNATDLTGAPFYAADAEVEIEAVANPGYRFLNWTAPAGSFANDSARQTTFTMPGQDATVTATFVQAYALNVTADPEIGGTASDLTDDAPYAAGTGVNITAVPEQGYVFVNWTSQPGDIINDEEAAQTFLTMPAADVTVTANFQMRPEVPTVTTNAATDVREYSARLNMTYTTGNFTSVYLRFEYSATGAAVVIYTPWVSMTEDGTYNYVLTDLAQNTEYEFEAQLSYDDTVREGGVRSFRTDPRQTIFFPPCFIATAAYGTPSAEEIDVLREFRDVVLAQSGPGSRVIALYYRLSPPVAEVISESNLMRTLTRELLVDPVVRIIEATGHLWRK